MGYPWTAKLCRFEWTSLKKQGCGLLVAMCAMLSLAMIESIRVTKALSQHKSVCDENIFVSKMSIFWLIPCFVLFGIAEILFVIPANSFYFSQSPPSMKSAVEALRGWFNGFGNWFAAAFVFFARDWLKDDDLNNGHLEFVYLSLACVVLIFLLFFIIMARRYEYCAPMEDSRIAKDNYHSSMDKTYITPTNTIDATSKRVKIPTYKTERKHNEMSFSTTTIAFGSIQ